MDIVFLGHQTVLLERDGTRILVDPVFRPRLAAERAAIFPPKTIEIDALLPIAAVVLSHTHLDHLDGEALDAINKDALVFVSTLSYGRIAPHLATLGFDPGRVIPLQPTGQVRVGPFRVGAAKFGRLSNEFGLGEPDVTPVVVRDADDVVLNFIDLFPDHPREVHAIGPVSAIITAWNYTHSRGEIAQGPVDPSTLADSLSDGLAGLFDTLGVPNVLMVGNGFVLEEQYAGYNAHMFPVTREAVCAAANLRCQRAQFSALEEGRRYRLSKGVLEQGDRVPWYRPTASDLSQTYDAKAPAPQGRLPFLGDAPLDDGALARVESFLDDTYRHWLQFRYLTQYFFAGLVVNGAYHEGLGLKLTSRTGPPLCYRFLRSPKGVAFLDAEPAELSTCHVVVEITAQDFLGLMDGDIVLIDPVYYDVHPTQSFLANLPVPATPVLREPLGVFDPFYHDVAVARALGIDKADG